VPFLTNFGNIVSAVVSPKTAIIQKLQKLTWKYQF
jgi:hypothetical protein